MKKVLALFCITVSLYSNESEAFFKASKDNFLLCRAGYETYVLLSSNNASIEEINKTKYIRYKQKDFYFPLSGCHPVKDKPQSIVY